MSVRRFSLYNPLIDIAVWIFVVSFVVAMTVAYADLGTAIERPLLAMVTIVGYANWLFCAFLVCARFMRDEFAEAVWQRAATYFTVIIVVLPTVAVIGFYVLSPYLGSGASGPSAAAKAAIAAYPDPRTWEKVGALRLANYIAAYVPALFLILYKWHRWRAGR